MANEQLGVATELSPETLQ